MRFLLILCLQMLISCEQPDTLKGQIVGVHDGDSATLRTNSQTYKLRLQGIDAPELGQEFGRRSKQGLSDLIFGTEVSVTDMGKDRYGRTLAIIHCDGVNINQKMVEQGWAWHYKKYSSDKQLSKGESLARKEKKGLWQQTQVTAPWDYRKQGASARSATTSSGTSSHSNKSKSNADYWLNTRSAVRHNKHCKWHGNTSSGRPCTPHEGKPCGDCGG